MAHIYSRPFRTSVDGNNSRVGFKYILVLMTVAHIYIHACTYAGTCNFFLELSIVIDAGFD